MERSSSSAAALVLLLLSLNWPSSAWMQSLFPEEALPTDSGYLVVNQTSGARMFYAYYEAISPEDELEKTPIILWLQGGPGCSGMIGNFYELGPWRVGEDLKLHENTAPWNHLYGLLFLDNPVGTGFSIAPNLNDIPTDEEHVARDVYTALQAFFDRNETFRTRPFYVTGESYAGKYVPAVGNYILNEEGSSKALRLDGVAIGNGLTHPITQVQIHAPTAYSMGLIDGTQRAILENLAERVVSLIKEQDWAQAHVARTQVLQYIENVTGLATLYDVRRTVAYYTTGDGKDYLSAFLNKAEVQSMLKTEVQEWEVCSEGVSERMANDTMKSTKKLVEVLLGRVPVLLYQGQFDLQDGVASSEAWMQLIEWDGLPEFFASERKVWKEQGILAGYVRSHGTLTHVVVSNAGHLVPTDQNYHSQLMIQGWISGNGIVSHSFSSS